MLEENYLFETLITVQSKNIRDIQQIIAADRLLLITKVKK